MRIGLALFDVFVGLLVVPSLFDIDVSRNPCVQVAWAALLLVSIVLAASLVFRGRGIRD